jgi:hypothetical protein
MAKQPIITTDDPNGLPEEFRTWVCLKPSTGEVYEYIGDQWVVTFTLSKTDHQHPSHGDINFTGTISADGVQGITGEFEGTFKKIKIQDGIITEFELE